MKDRIKEFIDYKGISGGELADMLDVQRSNISHILNGRNKPGAALLERFLTTFPEVNARWLLTGKGSMINIKPEKQFQPSSENLLQHQKFQDPELPFVEQKKDSPEVEKVILFYSDGTFSSYNPNK
jgi:transcriptional regulator with XRE-family HTH domain